MWQVLLRIISLLVSNRTRFQIANITSKISATELAKITALYSVWRITLLIFGFVALTFLPKVIEGRLVLEPVNFWQSWANWDGGHFLGIAENGFKFVQQYAFFPLFPLLISLTSPVFLGNSLTAGLVVANLAGVITAILFYKLVKFDSDKNFSLRSLNYFLFFPTAFFLGAVYSESLFLALTLAAFYFIRKKQFLLTSILATLTTLTKPYGILITVSLLVEYFAWKKFRLKFDNNFLLLLLPIIAFTSYLNYLKNTTGDPFIFVRVQEIWARFTANPVATIWNYYLSFFITPVNIFFGIRLIEFALVILVLAIIITSWKKLRLSYLIYLLLLFLTFATSGNFTSFPRFVLVLWPVFLIIAAWGENFLFDFFYKLISITLLGLFCGLFLAGFFVA